MIKRALKELMTEWRVMLFCLFLMFVVMIGLSKFQTDFIGIQGCGMDAFAFSSEWMSTGVFIVCIFLSISINKNNFKPQRVVLSKKNSSVWNYTIIKTVIVSLVMSAFVFIITALVSITGFSVFFNWNLEESVFFLFTGYVMKDINYPVIFIAYFCQAFFGICTAALAPMLTFWAFKSYMAGAAITTIAILVGNASGAEFIYGQNVFYDKMINGMDARYHFIFPAIVLVILMAAGSLKTKRDFI